MLQEVTISDHGERTLRVAARYEGTSVGLEVVLADQWEQVVFDQNVSFTGYRGVVELQSVGVESDRFVQALARCYGEDFAGRSFAVAVPFTGISLEGNPAALHEEPVRIKLFYGADEEDETRYAEAFLVLDLAARVVQLNEKDADYRVPRLRALTQG